MSALMLFAGTKLGIALLTGGGLVAGLLAPKLLRPFAKKQFGGIISATLNLKVADPVKAQLIQNFVMDGIKLAEYCIPDRGKGQAKKDLVVKALGSIPGLPGTAASALGLIVQEVFDSMDDELKAAIK